MSVSRAETSGSPNWLNPDQDQRALDAAAERIWLVCRALGWTLSSELAIKQIAGEIAEIVEQLRARQHELTREVNRRAKYELELKRTIGEKSRLITAQRKELLRHGLETDVCGLRGPGGSSPAAPPSVPQEGRDDHVVELPAGQA